MDGSVYDLPSSAFSVVRHNEGWDIITPTGRGELLVDPPMHINVGGANASVFYWDDDAIRSVCVCLATALWISAHVGIDLVDSEAGLRYAVGTQEALFLHDG